ncbi:plectin-like isoform X13 [Lates japonicus]|uniref:Plectin-like isoform X13 n=1 Tax=Lates japonicus TaxID=270547 RepID=A0AAD3QY85_LATJO|nr:plectin-like isoform X13 [Lates japonicus]
MAMYEPAYLPPNAEEQDFIQAYENVREKYKADADVTGPPERGIALFASDGLLRMRSHGWHPFFAPRVCPARLCPMPRRA